MKDLRLRKFSAVLPLFAAYSLVTASLKAQATTTTTTTTATTTAAMPDEPQVLEKFVVTGSNIPMAADALSVPVLTVDQSTIKDSGVSADTLDLLRKVAPNISGVGEENAQILTGTNFGGASVAIKGLPTLVLVDGRRVANDPAESTGGTQFVDLNMIPPAAIDRIEVLEDGASAIYGSDAIGGVINIILKKDYNGWVTGAHYGFSTESGRYEERSGYIMGGVSNDKTSITVSAEYAQHNNLFLAARPYTNPIYGTYTSGGVLEIYDNLSGNDNFYQLAPGVNAPPGGGTYTIDQLVANGTYVPKTADQIFEKFNLASGETMLGSLKRYSAMVNLDHKIFGSSLEGFGNVLFSNVKTASQLNAQPLVPFVQDAWTDINVEGFSSSPPPAGVTYIPNTAPTNPFSQAFLDQNQSVAGPGGVGSGEEILARERITAAPRIYQNNSTLYRVVGGLKGDITSDIHWEGAVNINRYELAYQNPGLYDTNALAEALADGQINPFAAVQAPGALTGVVGTAFVNMISTLNQFDFKVDGNVFELPAGNLGFAVGTSYVRENLAATPDINSLPNSTGTTAGWSNATTFKDFSANRDFWSAYGEVNVPVTSGKMNVPGAYAIDIDGAVRHDAYSGAVGSTTNPEVTLSYEPIDDQLKLRVSAGKSFIAPQLYSLYGPVTAGSTDAINYTTINGAQKTNVQFNGTSGSNPDLDPEKANSWAAGFTYTPKFVPGLTLAVDYSQIGEKGLIGTVPAATIIQSVETFGTASPYAADVHFNTANGAGVTGTGQISSHSTQQVYVNANLLNLGGQDVNSADIKLDYKWRTSSFGKFDVSSAWTYYEKYTIQEVPTEPYYPYVGSATAINGTTPRWRTYTTVDWSEFGFDAFVGVTFVESVTDHGTGGDALSGFESVGSFTAFDFGLTYDFSHLHVSKYADGLSVTLGINNAFDRQPPLAVAAFPDTNADVGAYDGAVGRMFYVEAKYSF
ncbi:MAG TPA: TonB-dependent receptor [Opitutaceae bacterium]|jgi:iron complex outermembrane receptor protein